MTHSENVEIQLAIESLEKNLTESGRRLVICYPEIINDLANRIILALDDAVLRGKKGGGSGA